MSSWLSSLQLSALAPLFKEQGIQGDVLVQLDNEALKDLGVDSVGQRLALLGGIFKLKEVWGIDIDQGDYRPQSEDIVQNTASGGGVAGIHGAVPSTMGPSGQLETPVTVPQLIACLRQRDDRIIRLEQELRRTTVFLAKFQYDFTGICRYQGLRAPTTDYAFQPFAPAASHPATSSAARKSSSGIASGIGAGVAASSTSLTSPVSHHGRFLTSPAGSMASLPKNTSNPMHPPGSAGLQSSLDAQQQQSLAQAQAQAQQQQQQQLRNPAVTAAAATADDAEERIRTPTSAVGAMEPPSPGFVSQGDQFHVGGEGYNNTPYNDSNGGLSPLRHPSAVVSTPTSATYPPWMRSDRGGSLSGNATPGGTTSLAGSSSRGGATTGSVAASRGTPTSPRNPSASGTQATSPVQPASSKSLQTIQQQPVSSGPPSAKEALGSAAQSSTASSASQRDFVGTATTLGTGDNPYKSFRVTLEDPCYKVLPAALKKYKINDDWRLYALFICYGTTERCLSYDEKPLLLFQKLKEARQNPVFMLRHIRDVKSPISIANAKAAARRGSAASAGRKNSTAGSTTAGQNGAGSAGTGKAPATRVLPASEAGSLGRSALVAVSSALAAAPANSSTSSSAASSNGNILVSGPAAALPRAEPEVRTFAIAIYPYVCERDDEFDVSVGDTFVVLSKAKGWWVVQRDAGASGAGDVLLLHSDNSADGSDGAVDSAAPMAEIKSGWVPAGCLIETSQPLAPFFSQSQQEAQDGVGESAGPSTPSALNDASSYLSPSRSTFAQGQQPHKLSPQDQTRAPIPPHLITSTSTPGVMLMDYSSAVTAAATATAPGTDPSTSTSAASSGVDGSNGRDDAKLELKKDDRLRVFKRYNHWSYCVQENGGNARGWVPSWYIGKISSRAQQPSSHSQNQGQSQTATATATDGGQDKADGEASVANGHGTTGTADGPSGDSSNAKSSATQSTTTSPVRSTPTDPAAHE